MKTFTLLIAAGLLAFGSVVNATTVDPQLVLDFGTGVTSGGTLAFDGTNATGADITIGAITVANAAVSNGSYTVTNGMLDFDTAANTLTIVGGVASLGIVDGTTLFTGGFTSFDFASGAYVDIFEAVGGGNASGELLGVLGETAGAFSYVGFSLESNIVGQVLSTDILATQLPKGIPPPAVPIPAAAWLFGSGLIGLVGVARRKV